MCALIQIIDATKGAQANSSSVTGSRGTICFHPMRFDSTDTFAKLRITFSDDSMSILYVP